MYLKKTTNSLLASIAVIFILAVVISILIITHAPYRYGRPLDIGLTLDLVIILPLVPLLFDRRGGEAKVISSLLFTGGILAAGWLVPAAQQGLLHHIKIWIVPVVEILSIAFLIVKVKKALSAYKKTDDASGDFYTELKRVSFSIVPNRIADVVSSEIAVIYYLFFNHEKVIYNEKRFSYHKETGIIALFGVLIFMVVVETTAFHLLLHKWSPKTAWILTLISTYAGFQLWGMARAFFKRPIEVTNDALVLRYGLLAETTIPFGDIIAIEPAKASDDSRSDIQPLSPLKRLDSYNLILKLRRPGRLYFIYGKVKNYETLGFHVDNKALFEEVLNSKLILLAD